MPDSSPKFGPFEVLVDSDEVFLAGPSYIESQAVYHTLDRVEIADTDELSPEYTKPIALAHLLSAAPELRDSVKSLLVYVERLQSKMQTPEGKASLQSEIDAAKFALAKAEGRPDTCRVDPETVYPGDDVPGWMILEVIEKQRSAELPDDIEHAIDQYLDDRQGALA